MLCTAVTEAVAFTRYTEIQNFGHSSRMLCSRSSEDVKYITIRLIKCVVQSCRCFARFSQLFASYSVSWTCVMQIYVI